MEQLNVNGFPVFRLVHDIIASNTYILKISPSHAVIVDPHDNAELIPFLKQSGITDITVLLTHEHPDHTCGIPLLKPHFQVRLICSDPCANSIADRRNNRPILLCFVLSQQDRLNGKKRSDDYRKNWKSYECQTDISFTTEYCLETGGESFHFVSTPGHSPGSCCILWKNAVFTGDSLLGDNMPTITRFPGGNMMHYQNITIPFLKNLPAETLVFPGHGDPFPIEQSSLFEH